MRPGTMHRLMPHAALLANMPTGWRRAGRLARSRGGAGRKVRQVRISVAGGALRSRLSMCALIL